MKYVYLVYHYDDGWHWKISRNRDGGITVAHSPDWRPYKSKSAAISALRSFTNKVTRDEVNIEVRPLVDLVAEESARPIDDEPHSRGGCGMSDHRSCPTRNKDEYARDRS